MAAMAEKCQTSTLSRLNHPTISLTLPANLTKTTVRTVSTDKSGIFNTLKPGSRYPPIFSANSTKVKGVTSYRLLSVPINRTQNKSTIFIGKSQPAKLQTKVQPVQVQPKKVVLPVAPPAPPPVVIPKVIPPPPVFPVVSVVQVDQRVARSVSLESSFCNSSEEDDLDDVVSLSDLMDLDMDSDGFDLDFDMFTAREAPFVASPGSDLFGGSESDLDSELESNLLSPDSPFGISLFPFLDKLPCPMSPALASPSVPAVPCLDSPPPSVSVPPTPLSRPLSPTNSMSSCSLSSPAVACEVKAEHIGQIIYQCSRCSIVYQTYDQMEKHLGQFHFPSRGDQGPFKLNEDNFPTLVKEIWEAALTSSSYSGYIRRMPEPILSCSPVPVVSGGVVKRVESLVRPDGMQSGSAAGGNICSTSLNLSANSFDYMDDTEADSEDNESEYWDDLSSNCSSDSSIDLSQLTPEMRIELEMPGPLLIPGDYSHSRRPVKKHTKRLSSVTTQPRKLYKTKPLKKQKSTVSTLQDASRKISEMVACIGKMVKPKKNKEKNYGGAKSVPKTPNGSSPALSQSGDESHSDGKVRRVKKHHGSKKALRKCRGVYGIHNQSNWCNMCKWKKRCSRFGEEDDDEKTAE